MILGNILAITLLIGICFGAFAIAPRTKKGVLGAVLIVLLFLLLLSYVGSVLVGPLDLRPMLFFTPFTVVCAGLWYHWKVKPRELKGG